MCTVLQHCDGTCSCLLKVFILLHYCIAILPCLCRVFLSTSTVLQLNPRVVSSSMPLPSSALLSVARTWLRARPPCPQPQPQQQQRWAHTVRIILKDDLPNGKAYKGEVLTVKAGYARNHLIPGKFALYATPENFVRLNMKDPDLETAEEKAARLARESMSEESAQELKAADILKHYLRNKVVSAVSCAI
jgi:Ribosomal protein L9, N-terminal domain